MRNVWKRMIAIAAALVMIVTSGTVQQVSAATGTVMNEITVTYDQSGARTMFDMVNDFRTGNDAWAWDKSGQREEYDGLQELTYDPVLEKVAMQRAAEIIFNWSHTRPNGEDCSTAFPDGYIAKGENIAKGQTSVEQAFISWREDEEDYGGQGHRRNMLGRNYTAIGIAHVIYNGQHYWVQEFGSPASGEELSDPVDGEQQVSIEVPDEEQTVRSISLGKDHLYYSGNSEEILNAYAASLSSVSVTTDKGRTYNIAAEWEYDAANNMMKVKAGSYVLPYRVEDTNKVMESGIPLEYMRSGYAAGVISGGSSYHEGNSMSLEVTSLTYSGNIVSWAWYKLENGTLIPVSGNNGNIYEKSELTPEDAGTYVVVYETPSNDPYYNAYCITTAKTITVTPHTPVETGGIAPTCTEPGVTGETKCSVCGEVITAGGTTIPALGHDWDAGTVKIEPTCTEPGEKTYTCSRCEETKTESIPAAGHKEIDVEAKDATCTEPGYTAGKYCTVCHTYTTGHEVIPAKGHTVVIDQAATATCTEPGYTEGSHCSVCDEILSEPKEIPALGHDWGEGTVTTEPTCTKDGEKTYTCSRCEKTKTETIPAKGHTVVIDEAVEATCTEPGRTEGSHCSVCQTVLVPTQEIPAKGHTEVKDPAVEATCTEPGHTEGSHCSACGKVLVESQVISALGHDWGEGTVTTEPTCIKDGEKTYTCSRCEETKTETIPALGHNEVEIPEQEPTCTEPGYTAGTYCTVCKTYTSGHEVIEPLGHDWDEGKVTKEPSCSEFGEKTYTCERCHTTKKESVDKLEHQPEILEAVAPTCTEDGLTEGSICSVCKTILKPQEPVSALGHDWDEGVITGKPTCTEDGVRTYTCRRCLETKDEAVTAVGHTEEIIPGKPATCAESGLTDGKKCSVCGVILEEQQIIPVLTEHSWDEGKVLEDATCTEDGKIEYTCTVCDTKKTEAIPAKGHTVVVDKGTPATCTESGLTDGKHCSVCNEILQEQVEIPAKGHIEVIDPAVEPTYTQEGKTEGSHCSVCGIVLKEQTTIPKLERPASDEVNGEDDNKTGTGANTGNTGSGTDSSQTSKAVQTGDTTDFIPILIVMFASISIVVMVLAGRSKKH